MEQCPGVSFAYIKNSGLTAYVPIVSGASDFDIILHMKQFILCLNKRSTGFKLYIRSLANDWSGNVDITNWERITEDIYIQPGFVVGHPAFPDPGHCGILDFDGAGIAAGEFIVNRRYDEWLDGTSGFRRYKNEK